MGTELTLMSWFLAALPIILLLTGILVFKWSTYKTGAITFIVTWILGCLIFKADQKILLLASSKGLSLALYVLLIIWGAILLYNIADQSGAVKVIGNTVSKVTENRLHQVLLLAWCFTSLLQGVSGFGVPIAVVAPILVIMGFEPMMAVTACLIGHSWAISFGSMGSSYNSIQLVTKIPGEIIGPTMALLFVFPIFATGFSVAHIYGGKKAVKDSFIMILITGSVMSFMLWFLNFIGMSQISSLGAAMSGCITTVLYSRLSEKNTKPKEAKAKEGMSFLTACFPYISLVVISIFSQIPSIKSALSKFAWGLDYPSVETGLGFLVEESEMYSKIQIFSHPAPILFISAALGYLVYTSRAGVSKGILSKSLAATVKKSVPTSVGIATMVMMALIMSDTGMTNLLARGIALVFGDFYPIASPFVGVLGSFLTGSNTNSNIMFGMLQFETAAVIGKSSVIMSAAQSVGGSLGVSISPSSIMMGSANVGLTGQESKVMSVTIKYCLPISIVLGLIIYCVTL